MINLSDRILDAIDAIDHNVESLASAEEYRIALNRLVQIAKELKARGE